MVVASKPGQARMMDRLHASMMAIGKTASSMDKVKSSILMEALMMVNLQTARNTDKANIRGAMKTKTQKIAATKDSGPKISKLVVANSYGLMALTLMAISKKVNTRQVLLQIKTKLASFILTIKVNDAKMLRNCDRNLHLLTSSSYSSPFTSKIDSISQSFLDIAFILFSKSQY